MEVKRDRYQIKVKVNIEISEEREVLLRVVFRLRKEKVCSLSSAE